MFVIFLLIFIIGSRSLGVYQWNLNDNNKVIFVIQIINYDGFITRRLENKIRKRS